MMVAAAAAVVAVVGLAVRTAASGSARSAVVAQAVSPRPSLHATPAADAVALNADVVRRLINQRGLGNPPVRVVLIEPEEPTRVVSPATWQASAVPGVIFFLKADCDCSKGFAVMISALAPHLGRHADCTAFIEGNRADADAFAASTGLAIPFIAQPESGLAREWGVTKAGCFALVEPDGVVEALWSGVSRQGFRDLARRIGVEPPLPEELLADIPGTATAGCPLDAAGSMRAARAGAGGAPADHSTETHR